MVERLPQQRLAPAGGKAEGRNAYLSNGGLALSPPALSRLGPHSPRCLVPTALAELDRGWLLGARRWTGRVVWWDGALGQLVGELRADGQQQAWVAGLATVDPRRPAFLARVRQGSFVGWAWIAPVDGSTTDLVARRVAEEGTPCGGSAAPADAVAVTTEPRVVWTACPSDEPSMPAASLAGAELSVAGSAAKLTWRHTVTVRGPKPPIRHVVAVGGGGKRRQLLLFAGPSGSSVWRVPIGFPLERQVVARAVGALTLAPRERVAAVGLRRDGCVAMALERTREWVKEESCLPGEACPCPPGVVCPCPEGAKCRGWSACEAPPLWCAPAVRSDPARLMRRVVVRFLCGV